jgi:hypothetical protein
MRVAGLTLQATTPVEELFVELARLRLPYPMAFALALRWVPETFATVISWPLILWPGRGNTNGQSLLVMLVDSADPPWADTWVRPYGLCLSRKTAKSRTCCRTGSIWASPNISIFNG